MISSTDAAKMLVYCYEYLCCSENFQKSGKVSTLLFTFLELCLMMLEKKNVPDQIVALSSVAIGARAYVSLHRFDMVGLFWFL
jgi:hypothetical protein